MAIDRDDQHMMLLRSPDADAGSMIGLLNSTSKACSTPTALTRESATLNVDSRASVIDTALTRESATLNVDSRASVIDIDHDLLMRALRKHCQQPWILLYVERWLKAPMQTTDGQIKAREQGTPQGGVVSPLLANLFLHYAFDIWVDRSLPGVRFCRYADDAVLHCKSHKQAQFVLQRIDERFRQCVSRIIPSSSLRFWDIRSGRARHWTNMVGFT